MRAHSATVHPGYYFDFPASGYFVVSLLPPPERFRHGVVRLLEACGGAGTVP